MECGDEYSKEKGIPPLGKYVGVVSHVHNSKLSLVAMVLMK